MLNLQLRKPSSGDWAFTCIKNLEDLVIKITFEEIRKLSKKKYAEMTKQRIS